MSLSHVRKLNDITDRTERVELARRGVEKDWSATKTGLAVKKENAPPRESSATATSAATPETVSPMDAAENLVDSLMGSVSQVSSPKSVARQPKEHPVSVAATQLEKPLGGFRGALEKGIGKLPANAPLLRMAIGVAAFATATVIVAGMVHFLWLEIMLRALSGFFWLVVALLLLRYLAINKDRLVSWMVNWVELMGRITAKDVDGVRAAARKFQPERKEPLMSAEAANAASLDEPAPGPGHA